MSSEEEEDSINHEIANKENYGHDNDYNQDEHQEEQDNNISLVDQDMTDFNNLIFLDFCIHLWICNKNNTRFCGNGF